METVTKNLFQRIAAIMEDVQYLSKDDTISYGNSQYKGLSEEKITGLVREAMIKHGVVILPVKSDIVRERITESVKTPYWSTSLIATYRIQNIDDPKDWIEVQSSGLGIDTQDKGDGKAMTYAFKYALLRTFAIPTGEDPDKVHSSLMDETLGNGKTVDKKTATNRADSTPGEPPQDHVCEICGEKLPEKVAKYSKSRMGQYLCWQHQKERSKG